MKVHAQPVAMPSHCDQLTYEPQEACLSQSHCPQCSVQRRGQQPRQHKKTQALEAALGPVFRSAGLETACHSQATVDPADSLSVMLSRCSPLDLECSPRVLHADVRVWAYTLYLCQGAAAIVLVQETL